MPYADTDFFVALIYEDDRLNGRAEHLLTKHKGTIWTSMVTVLEIVLVAKKRGANFWRIVRDLLEIAEVRGAKGLLLLQAAYYVDEKNVGIFDAFHAVMCEDDQLIGSDSVYDKLGVKRIPL